MKYEYFPRIFDDVLDFSLKSKGGVLVVGPKWCGKTTTCERHAKSVIRLLPLETRQQYVNFAKASPERFLNHGDKPLLIDEWQIISFIWNSLKEVIDKNHEFGQFILTGSVTDKNSYEELGSEIHTANGRIVKKIMRTMSLYESKDSIGTVSLMDLQKGIFNPSISEKTIDDYAYFICRGGWPLSLNKDKKIALSQAKDYYQTLYQDDIFSLSDIQIRKNIVTSEKFFSSYARNIGTQCGDNIIIEDVGFDKKTFDKYFVGAQRLFVLDETMAWNPNLRSKSTIRTKNTRYFVDPSIAVAALGLNPESLYKDMKYFGFLFESLVIRDLKIYADAINAKIYHFRDSLEREADAVIVYENGDFGLIEIKLGDDEDINEASLNLKKIEKDLVNKPNFLMVITKTPFAYQGDDKVYVVPLATLKP